MRESTSSSRPRTLLLVLMGTGLVVGIASQRDHFWGRPSRQAVAPSHPTYALTISYPYDRSVFPPEIVAPRFRWTDTESGADEWRVTVRFERTNEQLESVVGTPSWRPSPEQWALMKKHSIDGSAVVSITGCNAQESKKSVSLGTVSFTTSTDSLKDSVFYREVILPFSDAVKDPSRIRWRYGSIASDNTPPVVLENLPVCGNCHSFSANGSLLGMDVDYGNDKGAYALTHVEKVMNLVTSDIITWSDYKRDPNNPTFGLLSQVSPDGQFVVSTVKDRSVFVPRPDLAFSQLFFPIQGILAVYDIKKKTFNALPGADDSTLVQSNPVWSPDGRTIVFARSSAYHLKNLHDKQKVLLSPEECQEFVDGQKLFKFDLYRVAFNGGKGGVAEPLPGASGNGMSNYFPRFSPDGRWIVFCKANSFMLLQPDSKLYIVPAAGGEARPLRCNTALMNSWHSWSSNGRWLIFSSKVNSPYTQLFVTHIDENGLDAPAVLLEQFTASDRAANIPEFVAAPADAIERINPQFLDDVSLWRSGMALMEAGDLPNATVRFREALALNPRNVKAHIGLGNTLEGVGQADEALGHYTEAVRLDATSAIAHINVGNVYLNRKECARAVKEYEVALKLEPDNAFAHFNLGQCLLTTSQYDEALVHLSAAHRESPNNAPLCFLLGKVHERLGHRSDAAGFYREATRIKPDYKDAKDSLTALEASGTGP